MHFKRFKILVIVLFSQTRFNTINYKPNAYEQRTIFFSNDHGFISKLND